MIAIIGLLNKRKLLACIIQSYHGLSQEHRVDYLNLTVFPMVMNLLIFKNTPLIALQQLPNEKGSITQEINSLQNHLKEDFAL